MEDFQSGKADVVVIDEPILRYQVMKNGKNADMQIVPGPSTITLSPAVAAGVNNSFQHHFEQAAIRFFSDEKQVQTITERYFPTGVIVEELVDDVVLRSWFSRDGLARYTASIIVPISLLTIYLTFYSIIRYYRYFIGCVAIQAVYGKTYVAYIERITTIRFIVSKIWYMSRRVITLASFWCRIASCEQRCVGYQDDKYAQGWTP